MSQQQFLDLFTQTREVYATYKRRRFGEVIVYEFLLPLTRESELRRALDALFFADTIDRRLREVGLERLTKVLPMESAETSSQYLTRVRSVVAEKFVGYSITHVQGRYRVGDLISRGQLGRRLEREEPYLADESTAVVRFIIPCKGSLSPHDDDLDGISRLMDDVDQAGLPSEVVRAEARLIRSLFFYLFVEDVVRTVRGEEEIWLLEFGPRPRLYVWEADR